MLTQVVGGRVYDFSHVVGRSAVSGLGFTHPVSLALGQDDVVYVLNRGWEQVGAVPWNRTFRGARVSKLTLGTEPHEEELVLEFSGSGNEPGQVIWPAGIAVDSRENVYVTDECLNRVSVFDNQGKFLSMWGAGGSGDGELQGPSGIVFDSDDQVYIVDSRNHRVQKFTKDGAFLSKWGSLGDGDGQLNSPWGIALDQAGDVYVTDHKNHRVQKYSPDGQYLSTFGKYGTGRGELNRPSDVVVDPEGDVYVCDWANNRVQIYQPDGKFVTSLIGDAQELSKWAQMAIDSSPDMRKRRREVRSLDVEWRFDFPVGLCFDPLRSRIIATDSQRQRLQIYNKLTDYSQPPRTI